jgi:hypothetical protein
MSKLACIKLLHPGAEKDLPKNVSKGKINWNTDEKHKRKFMKLTGKYLDGDNFKEDILTFWEE